MTIHIANLTINQSSNGLYSINDIHRASGGLAKHQPAAWMRLQSTTNLIRLMESQVINQQNGNVIETFVGGDISSPLRGTYVCRKLVVAYALWISTEFFSHVLDVFLDVVDGVYARVTAQNKVIEQQTLQLTLFSGELQSMRKRDPRAPETLPVLTGIEARNCKAMFDKLVDDGYLVADEYYPKRIQYKPTQKAMDAGIIAGVKNRTVLFNPAVLEVLK
jgi:hypothetical protein